MLMDEITRYRLKVEKDGKSLVDIPGVAALPGLLIAPKASIIGMVAAPMLGCNIRLEGENGKKVDIEGTVRKAAENVVDTASKAARTISEKIDEAWSAMSAEDAASDAAETPGEEKAPSEDAAYEDLSNESIVEELAKDEQEKDVPTIKINPEE